MLGLLQAFLVADEVELVAELEPQFRHRGHLDVGAGHAGDRNAEELVEAEFVHGLAQHVPPGHEHAPERDRAGRLHEIDVAAAADHALELFQVLRRADGQQDVAQLDRRVVRRIGHQRFARATEPGNHHAGFAPARDRAQRYAREVDVFHDQIDAGQRLDAGMAFAVKRGGLRFGVDPEEPAQDQERADDPEDAHRIRDRVGECWQVGVDLGRRR